MSRITQHGNCARIGLTVLALCLIAGPAAPGLAQTTLRYVDINANGTEDGKSWENAFTDLQDALVGGIDEVWVAAGTYKPGSLQTDSFTLIDGIEVYGGFIGTETLRSQRNPGCGATGNCTILSGDIDDDGTLNATNSQHVVTAISNTLATVLDGFTVTMGYADGSMLDDNGGGMLISHCADVTVANCKFENNFSENGGGAVFVYFYSNVPSSSETTFENCVFNDNETDNSGGGMAFSVINELTEHNLTVTDTVFNRNNTLVAATGGAQGGAMSIRGADQVVITDCDFNNNFAVLYGGALELLDSVDEISTAVATITRCTFTGNGIKSGSNPPELTIVGGAVRIRNARKSDFINCTFTANKTAGAAGGAIWAVANASTGTAYKVEFNLTDCKFLRNEMTLTANSGGGAVWVEGRSGTGSHGEIRGTWTRCTFIENKGFKGGAAYLTSTAEFEIKDCKFISNHSFLGGGALCISDKQDFTTTVVRICNSDFIGNTADDKGGAVYNRGGSTTTMVNCIVAGNTADSLGGGTCNADDGFNPTATTTFDLHNCLLAGNLADTPGNLGGGHLNRDGGVSTLINCTVVLNEAYGDYGGIENGSDAGRLKVQNCIVWGNIDDDDDGVDDQLHYGGTTFVDGDVDKGVIEDCDDCFGGDVDNKDVDPDVVNIIASPTWVDCTYDAATGITTFEMTVEVSALENESLFQPDGASPLQVLIKSVDTEEDTISCYGNWTDLHSFQTKTATIYDYHIDTGSSAIDYGDSDYTPADVCDLDPGDTLDVDLDLVDRAGNPDSGAYEDN